LKDDHTDIKSISHRTEIAPGGISVQVDILDRNAAQPVSSAGCTQKDFRFSLKTTSGQLNQPEDFCWIESEPALGILEVMPQSFRDEKCGGAVGIVALAGKSIRLGHAGANQDGIGIKFVGFQKIGDIFRVVLRVRIQGQDGTATITQGEGKTLTKGIALPAIGGVGYNFHLPASGNFFGTVRGPVVYHDDPGQVLSRPIDDFPDRDFSIISRDKAANRVSFHDAFLKT
jgi:hypothetical protein